MSLFEIQKDRDETADLATGFLSEANQQAEQIVRSITDAVQRFWYRNKDEAGNPSPVRHEATGDWAGSQEPTGAEILQAMGNDAATFLAVSAARVMMLMSVQEQLGTELIDPAQAAAPYELVFNKNGSLNSATLKE